MVCAFLRDAVGATLSLALVLVVCGTSNVSAHGVSASDLAMILDGRQLVLVGGRGGPGDRHRSDERVLRQHRAPSSAVIQMPGTQAGRALFDELYTCRGSA